MSTYTVYKLLQQSASKHILKLVSFDLGNGIEFCEMEKFDSEADDFYEDAPMGKTITVLNTTSVVDLS